MRRCCGPRRPAEPERAAGRGHVLAAPDVGRPTRPGAAAAHLAGAPDRVAEGGRGATDVVVVDFTPEVAELESGSVRRRGAAPAAPAPGRGGAELPLRLPRRRHRRHPARARRGEFAVEALPLVTDGALPSSSTLVRHAVIDGDFGRVRELCDHPFRSSGVVVRGDQRGRELGFPTANVAVQPGMAVPADGVYAGWVTRLDRARRSRAGRPRSRSAPIRPSTASSAGSRPTSWTATTSSSTAYRIAIDFYARLRGQVKYAGLEALIHQIHADVEQARHLLHPS